MTKRECRLLWKAMWYLDRAIEDGGDYDAGIDILANLLRADRKRRKRQSNKALNPTSEASAG